MSPAAKVVSITARSNPLVVRLRKLAADPGGYRRAGEVWVEGEHLVATFVQRGGRALQVVIDEAAWQLPRLRSLAQRADAVAIVPPALMRALTQLESPPPIAAAVRWPGAGTLRPDAPSVVLDRVQDAGNVGSILRSAAAFGFAQVVALAGTAALWSPKVLRAGMGAHWALNLVEAAGVDTLSALQVPLLATSPHAGERIDRAELPWPCAWVLGHEGQGVDPTLAARCAKTLAIVQPGEAESLNVAAAAAVCLHESARRRERPQ